ncbi:hypothetical protein HELRODRAFT_191220 [Helobdella robusta]|uniref:VWFA domain-containing protein n=1 Tax=Helobdella robusta TaxID=6412 RepID=T1FSR3_HELRO|nr:hypothetical protein HELRODRAFT_191220 [Helobdella robusta]ESO06876.1 hypothetical protein HELRODRAFT_191220 [Helobdella robusta]
MRHLTLIFLLYIIHRASPCVKLSQICCQDYEKSFLQCSSTLETPSDCLFIKGNYFSNSSTFPPPSLSSSFLKPSPSSFSPSSSSSLARKVEPTMKIDRKSLNDELMLELEWDISTADMKYVRGFLLTLDFVWDGRNHKILRSFLIKGDKYEGPDGKTTKNKLVTFRHDCITLFPSVQYSLTLTTFTSPSSSFPLSSSLTSSSSSASSSFFVQSSTISTEFFSPDNHIGNHDIHEARASGEWTATLKLRIFFGTASSMMACFHVAPAKFLFYSYYLYLSRGLEHPNIKEHTHNITLDPAKNAGEQRCVMFRNIEDGVYYIFLRPASVHGCTCKDYLSDLDVEPSCVEYCLVTQVGPMSVKYGKVIPTLGIEVDFDYSNSTTTTNNNNNATIHANNEPTTHVIDISLLRILMSILVALVIALVCALISIFVVVELRKKIAKKNFKKYQIINLKRAISTNPPNNIVLVFLDVNSSSSSSNNSNDNNVCWPMNETEINSTLDALKDDLQQHRDINFTFIYLSNCDSNVDEILNNANMATNNKNVSKTILVVHFSTNANQFTNDYRRKKNKFSKPSVNQQQHQQQIGLNIQQHPCHLTNPPQQTVQRQLLKNLIKFQLHKIRIDCIGNVIFNNNNEKVGEDIKKNDDKMAEVNVDDVCFSTGTNDSGISSGTFKNTHSSSTVVQIFEDFGIQVYKSFDWFNYPLYGNNGSDLFLADENDESITKDRDAR